MSFDPKTTFEEIRALQRDFVAEREWEQFHKPRSLILALTKEVGELAEIFQWKGDEGSESLPEKERVHVGEELSDCILYLIRIADVMDINLPAAIKAKMEKNAAKYPAALARGKSDKYTSYNPEGGRTATGDQTIDAKPQGAEDRGKGSDEQAASGM